jgi:hypothetical protein
MKRKIVPLRRYAFQFTISFYGLKNQIPYRFFAIEIFFTILQSYIFTNFFMKKD